MDYLEEKGFQGWSFVDFSQEMELSGKELVRNKSYEDPFMDHFRWCPCNICCRVALKCLMDGKIPSRTTYLGNLSSFGVGDKERKQLYFWIDLVVSRLVNRKFQELTQRKGNHDIHVIEPV